MSVNIFENNGKKISENTVKLKLEQNIKSLTIIIWSTYVQREQIYDHFMMSLPDTTEKQFTVTVIIESV